MKYIFPIILVSAVIISACTGTQLASAPATETPAPTATPEPEPCRQQAQEFITNTEELFAEWDDANKLAQSTSRISLSDPVSELQRLRREANNLEAPGCAQRVQTLLVDYMGLTIDGYLMFMGDASDSAVNTQFDEANEASLRFVRELQHLEQGVIPYGENTPVPTITPTPIPTNTPTPVPEVVETDKGTFEVPGEAFLDGRDLEANPPVTKRGIQFWNNPPGESRFVQCSKTHGTRATLRKVEKIDDEYYFYATAFDCGGWIAAENLSVEREEPVGEEVD